MGVYINMEMPTAPVLFCIHPDGKVFADLEGGWREYQAVPVPPHGDLFDISKVKITPSDDEDIAYEIDFGKTIIPAEPFNNLSKPCKDDADFPICTKASPASLGIYKKAEENE